MNNIKNIIILGAGASKSEKAPLQNEWFKYIFDYIYLQNKGEDNRTLENQEKIFVDFFKVFWNIDKDNYLKVDFPTVEECLGMLDIAHDRNESLNAYTKEKINEIRNAITCLMAKILDEKIKNRTNHEKLVELLKREGKLKDTVFISLNYDIIIDNVLTNLPGFRPDYGIDFAKSDKPEGCRRSNGDNSILLLKIHGSLNWLYCPTCKQMKLTPKEKSGLKATCESMPCKICKKPMESMIIPPTFYKDMSNPFIRDIFSKADKVLREAKNIFICGYSFPEADMDIKYLLKRAEMFQGETPQIYVINNHDDKQGKDDNSKDEKNEKKIRFTRFFKKKENICYTNLSFEMFASMDDIKQVKDHCM